jgi:hypothetical protein
VDIDTAEPLSPAKKGEFGQHAEPDDMSAECTN